MLQASRVPDVPTRMILKIVYYLQKKSIDFKKKIFLPLLSITTCSEFYLKFHLKKFSNNSEVRYFWVFPNFLRITDPIFFKSSFAWTWPDIQICLVFGVKSHSVHPPIWHIFTTKKVAINRVKGTNLVKCDKSGR